MDAMAAEGRKVTNSGGGRATLGVTPALNACFLPRRSVTAVTVLNMGKPMNFAVFLARKSGERPLAGPPATWAERAEVRRTLTRLYNRYIPESEPSLRLAQLALIRCAHLTNEMTSIERIAPEASAMIARSVIETSLVGSYLAYGDHDFADRLLKRQAAPARRLLERIVVGDVHPGLDLLKEVRMIQGPLDSDLSEVRKLADLQTICRELDTKAPFSSGNLASLLYDEAYSALSEHVVHPTAESLRRHEVAQNSGRLPPPALVRVAILHPRRWRLYIGPDRFDHVGAGWASTAAMIALAASLSRALAEPSALLDRGAQEIASNDGMSWSASPARMAAASQVAKHADLSVASLNVAGSVVRTLAVTDAFRALSHSDQLVVALEVLDLCRSPQGWLRVLGPRVSRFRRRDRDRAGSILGGAASSDPQAMLATLLLVYSSAWPDDPDTSRTRLSDFDGSSPHKAGALDRVLANSPRTSLKEALRRQKQQISDLP
ncbi:MAG: hypothetical protein NTX33_10820 [Propionibacteriales bacterium]|nr:hypothetical protein [Propionibacteriales bacterium]